MAQVIRSYPIHPPMVSMKGARPWTWNCTWLVECDGRMPGGNVVVFGRTSPSGIPVPQYGDTLNLTVDGSQIVDASVYALDFDTRLLSGQNDQTYQYYVDVTWREPNSTGGGGVGVRGEHPEALPFRDQPTLRPPEVWVEYETITVPRYTGRNIQALNGRTSKNGPHIRAPNTWGIVVNANGEAIEPQVIEQTIAVLCAKTYVPSFDDAMQLNQLYANSVNSDTFLGYLPHFAKFRRAETGYPEYYNGQRYYEMVVKVDLSLTQWYIQIPNESTYYYDPAISGGSIVTPEDYQGRAITGRFFPIDLNGEFNDSGPVTLEYLLYEPAEYAGLVQYFT